MKFLLDENDKVIAKTNGRLEYHKGKALVNSTFYAQYTSDNSSIIEANYVESKPAITEYQTLLFSGYTLNDGEVIGSYTAQDIELDEAKALKTAEVRGLFAVDAYKPINGFPVDTDGRQELLRSIAKNDTDYQEALTNGVLYWIMFDGSVEEVTRQQVIDASTGFSHQIGVALSRLKIALENIEAATTTELVEAVNYDA